MTPEERAEHKKKEIEAEFLRYKLARKLQAKKAKDHIDDVRDHVCFVIKFLASRSRKWRCRCIQ